MIFIYFSSFSFRVVNNLFSIIEPDLVGPSV